MHAGVTRHDWLNSSASETVLAGQPYLKQRLCSLQFKVSPASFFQTNPAQAEAMYSLVIAAAGAPTACCPDLAASATCELLKPQAASLSALLLGSAGRQIFAGHTYAACLFAPKHRCIPMHAPPPRLTVCQTDELQLCLPSAVVILQPQFRHCHSQPLSAEAHFQAEAACPGLQPTDTALDLFCGIGTITLALAQRCKAVIGVEASPAAVADAKHNARANGIQNAAFWQADLSDATAVTVVASQLPSVDVIVAGGSLSSSGPMPHVCMRDIDYSCMLDRLTASCGLMIPCDTQASCLPTTRME